MLDHPQTFDISLPTGAPSHYDRHLTRRLSQMVGYFADGQSLASLLAASDALVYEVYELERPPVVGELLYGSSVLHPGRVGDEYYMTKGHFHARLETGEIYYCLQGQGMMVLEAPDGQWSVQELRPGRVLYVPPCWAHRSVNTSSQEDLVLLFAYPGDAGHDYGTIERQGFRKRVVERDGRPEVVDNPQWQREGPNVP